MIDKAIDHLRPGARYCLTGDTLEGLTWLDVGQTRPTDAEIEAAIALLRRPSAADVRAEASRRMIQVLGARDAEHLALLISNGTREAVRLLRKSAANWTPEEAERAAVLEAIDQAIEMIRARSNALEPNPPDDYRADAHWL